MRLIVLLLFLLLFLVSCSNKNNTSFSSSDSLVIRFNASAPEEKVISTTNKTAINKMAAYLNGERMAQVDCRFDGVMLFYNSGALKDSVLFGYSTDTCQFFHHIDINAQPVKMSKEGASFLQSLAEGKSWY